MVFTVRARPESFPLVPAVIHKDGTSRIQIVREETDPLSYSILKALGHRLGVEVAVNTSLNVGTPILHTPAQAINSLQRSRGMTGLLMIGRNGKAYLVWHHIESPPKDAGRKLQQWVQDWRETH
jgi:carbamoyltransferase